MMSIRSSNWCFASVGPGSGPEPKAGDGAPQNLKKKCGNYKYASDMTHMKSNYENY
jgi:hypothetical protein